MTSRKDPCGCYVKGGGDISCGGASGDDVSCGGGVSGDDVSGVAMMPDVSNGDVTIANVSSDDISSGDNYWRWVSSGPLVTMTSAVIGGNISNWWWHE